MKIRNAFSLIALAAIITSCTQPTKSLSVSVIGNGSGLVTSNPTGINCISRICSSSFNEGTNVRLTATPNANSTFEGWSGACSGTGPCSVDMNTNTTVTASFSSTGTITDTVKPLVNISSPSNGQTVNAANLTVNGSASDDTAVTNLEYSLNSGARVALNPSTNFSIPVTLNLGTNTINVYAKDAAGNEGSSSVSVTYGLSGFTLEPQQAVFFVAQKAVAFWKVKITNRQNFNTGGTAFNSVTLENNAILGTGASKIQFAYRKTDSSQDEIVLEIGAGSSVPVGDYAIKVKAMAGAITQEAAVMVRVAPCSLGCQ
jgi:hypothetical protein